MGCHSWAGVSLASSRVETRAVAKHPEMRRTALSSLNGPNVSSAATEKPWRTVGSSDEALIPLA